MKNILSIMIILIIAITVNAQEMVAGGEEGQKFFTAQYATINSIGHFSEAWDNGNGFYLGYGNTHGHWTLMFQTGYVSYNVNEETGYTGEADFTMFPLWIGGRYFILTENIRPFIMAFSGVNIVTEKHSFADENVDNSTSHFAFQIGLGVSVNLSRNLQVELLGKYNSHLFDPGAPYNITGMEYGLGLNWVISMED